MIEVLLVPILEGAVPILFPALEPATGKDSHIDLRDPQELVECCPCLLQAPGMGVARRQPATHLIDGVARLPERGDGVVIAAGTKASDAHNPRHPLRIERV